MGNIYKYIPVMAGFDFIYKEFICIIKEFLLYVRGPWLEGYNVNNAIYK